jgi:hypothetical protein
MLLIILQFLIKYNDTKILYLLNNLYINVKKDTFIY